MLSQTEWEKLNDLTAAIYGIKSLTAMRTAFLQKLMNLIGYGNARHLYASVPIFQPRGLNYKFVKVVTAKYAA